MVPYSGADRRLASSVRAGDGAGVRAALQDGAGHHRAAPDGRLPLHSAAATGRADVITALLQAGADLHATSGMPRDDGGTALHLAGESGQVEALRLLATAGAPLDAADNKGRTAVHWAALRGQKDALVTLHTLGADLHAQDAGRANALHFAAASGALEVVRYLVESAGVSVAQLDVNKRSPYDVAKRKGQKHVVAYLKQKDQHSDSLRHQPSQQGPSAWVYRQESPPTRPKSHHEGSARNSETRHSYRARPHSQHGTSAYAQSQQNQHEVVSRSSSQHDRSAWNDSPQNQHIVASRSQSQHDRSAWNNSPQNQHIVASRSQSQQDETASNYSQQNQHEVLSRSRSQHKEHIVASRSQSQDGSATWSQGQRATPARQSQRDTSAWVQSQQQQPEEPRSALTLLTQQNQDCKKKIADLQKREAELEQRSAADQQNLAELRREVERLTGLLQSEGRDAASSREVAALREEVQHLTIMLDDTGRRAMASQEGQQRRIEALRSQEEQYRRTIADLTRRLAVAEESNGAMMAEARERERSETYLKGEVDRLHLALASAPKLEAYAELQARAHRLTEQDTIHRQAILALRRQLEAAARAPAQAPSATPNNTDQRKLREATLEAEKYKEEAATLAKRLQETMHRAAEAEKTASAYKHRWGECDRELREERESNAKSEAVLREENAELKGRMDGMKKKAVSRSLSRTTAHASSDG
ncbi:ankycorbin-like isoform X5 [Eriocheir sinensis]|uniref:ankycorbin-like isoform X5 n=1 Tax=Eriocheir sinensis TaxID=95602 RepID=UPI0021C5C1BB|nr:ankycorbin-like isoform X5 [Eriocheir sinensis]